MAARGAATEIVTDAEPPTNISYAAWQKDFFWFRNNNCADLYFKACLLWDISTDGVPPGDQELS
jgi:hypothetical protein